ncbi:MAG: YraN family protein [Clostridia bacterium]|nr:YraN family protein [Clostridia bacterium]
MSYSSQDLHKKLLGKKGEKLAVSYLKKQGLKILKTNYRTPFGEADILAQDKDDTVFVEVKTRTSDSYGRPSEAVTSQKRRRYIQMAKFYFLEQGEEENIRFDVVEVWADGTIEHISNAF